MLSQLSTTEQNSVKEFLVSHFNLSEMVDLTFRMGIDHDEIFDQNKTRYAINFIGYCQRRDLLGCLIEKIVELRQNCPFADWLFRMKGCTPNLVAAIRITQFVNEETLAEIQSFMAIKLGCEPERISLMAGSWQSTRLLLGVPRQSRHRLRELAGQTFGKEQYFIDEVTPFNQLDKVNQDAWRYIFATAPVINQEIPTESGDFEGVTLDVSRQDNRKRYVPSWREALQAVRTGVVVPGERRGQMDTSEAGLEAFITHYLTQFNGYVAGLSEDYDQDFCVDRSKLLAFLDATQPDKSRLVRRDESKFFKRLDKLLREKDVVTILRDGIKLGTEHFTLYYPVADVRNPLAVANYQQNIFSVTRQLHFSREDKRRALDMVIFVNGLPLITFELKNSLTNQQVGNAIEQYKKTRLPQEPLFRFGRCMVHMAVDDQEVWMTTELKGEESYFIPFNQGMGYGRPIPEARRHGAGNPINPYGLKTAYLWERILTKESLSNIVEKFARVIVPKDDRTGKKKPPRLVFPRFHQLDLVRKLLADVQAFGVGERYLVQHSAGSGKSFSIAWLAHQLVELTNERHEPIFDSVIVITDRVILNRQIRDTIKQYAHVAGVVAAVNGSRELAEALDAGKKIIVATIQTFPHVLEKVGLLNQRQFAIIIDEAHSGQGGSTSAKMHMTLGSRGVYQRDDWEEMINDWINSQRMLPNASYFAFTATPKNRTLETFGIRYPNNGKYYPFHVYTMKQAIEEKFIMDVLESYTVYESYYQLYKKVDEDPEFDNKRAQKRLRRYVEQHPHAIEQKTKIMVTHFMEEVMRPRKVGGRAKAMVVTSGRADAVQYKQAFDAFLAEMNLPYKALVAFSDSVKIAGEDWDEARLNGFPGVRIPEEFEKDEYRFLIVAEKFQTGFDQPLLHTMYVDKVLTGVHVVQTLSRLNRAHPDKKDTFILDFRNSTDLIQREFEPFYKTTILSEGTDFDRLNDLQDALDNYQVYSQEQVMAFMEQFIQSGERAQLDPFLDQSVPVFSKELDEDEQIDFKTKAKSFVRTYQFLVQITPFTDTYMESLKTFLKFLLAKLPAVNDKDLIRGLVESVDMQSYRLEREETLHILLEGNEELDPALVPTQGNKYVPEMDYLSQIVDEFNRRFGKGPWKDEDRLRQTIANLSQDVTQQAEYQNAKRYSDRQNARITFAKLLIKAFNEFIFSQTERYSEDEDLFRKFNNEPEFQEWLTDKLFREDYDYGDVNQ